MNLKFRRQHRVQIFIVDFFCHDLGLIIELEGAVHFRKEQVEHDANRDAYLRSLGYTVLRFPNRKVSEDIEGVLSRIAKVVHAKEQDR